MTFHIASRIAARALRAKLRDGLNGFRIFLACIVLGVAAIAAIGSVRAALMDGLTENAAVLLGGDAQIELTYRFAEDAELAWMQANSSQVSTVAEFRSMATVGRGADQDRALTQVKAVDDLYPLVGSVTLDPDLPLETAFAGDGNSAGAVMAPALMARLDVVVGDKITLGANEFIITAQIVDEPDNVGNFAIGPRTMVHLDDLSGSGLLQAGTLFTSKYRLTMAPSVDLVGLGEQLLIDLPSSGARWDDTQNGAPGIQRFVERLSTFLILVGLSGLAVGGVGIGAAVQAHMATELRTIGILKTIGASQILVLQTYAIQISILACGGILMGLLLGGSIPLMLAPVLSSTLPLPANFGVYPIPLAEAAVYGGLVTAIFTVMPLSAAQRTKAASLFRGGNDAMTPRPSAGVLLSLVTLTALLAGLAILFTGSTRLTLWTGLGILGALTTLWITSFAIRRVAAWANRRRKNASRPALRWAMSAIGSGRERSLNTLLALGLGMTVLAAIGQIDGNLKRAISGNLPDVAPSFFFIDIQPDQITPFLDLARDTPQVSQVDSAPMLRGVITKINDRPAAEVAGDHWVLRGDRGVTYASEMPSGTTLTDGAWWNSDYVGPPQISFAAEEAEEMGLQLGDTLTVNILGRDITGKITSFREVDFSNAGIGFILTINASALAGAPHSHIATVYADQTAEAGLLRQIAQRYPNITAIPVRDAIDRVASVVAGIASAITYGALITLITGFIVLMGAAATNAQARMQEAAILKTLGASRRVIATSFMLRSALLGSVAGGVALCVGCLAGWAVCTYVLDSDYAVIWGNALIIVCSAIALTVLANLIFIWPALNTRPAPILRSAD